MALSLRDAIRVHSTLQAIIKRVPQERIFLRTPARADSRFQSALDNKYAAIDRDRTICGLTSKAAGTHKSIGILVLAGQLSDATSLCRVLMENVFTLSWILQDSGLRLDIFVLADDLFRRRLAEVTLEHFQYRPQLCARAKQQLDDPRSKRLAKALEGSWEKWARREESGRLIPIGARGMFRDLGITGPGGQKQSFVYDAAYFDQSHHVHSTVWSMRAFDFASMEFFRLDVKPKQSRAREIMNAANLFMIQALSDFEKFTGADSLQPELDTAWEEMKGPTVEPEI